MVVNSHPAEESVTRSEPPENSLIDISRRVRKVATECEDGETLFGNI